MIRLMKRIEQLDLLGPAPICNLMSSIGHDDMPRPELAYHNPGTAAGWSADSALKLCRPSNAH
jgi:hypothetical protein